MTIGELLDAKEMLEATPNPKWCGRPEQHEAHDHVIKSSAGMSVHRVCLGLEETLANADVPIWYPRDW
jgi:hypothetical protein